MAKSVAPRRRGHRGAAWGEAGDDSRFEFPSEPSFEELIAGIRDILFAESEVTPPAGDIPDGPTGVTVPLDWLLPAKPAKVAVWVRRHSRDIVGRADAALLAIDTYLADSTAHNLGPPLDDIKPVPGSLAAVRWTLLAFRSSLTAQGDASDPGPIIATGQALWSSVCGLVSSFSEEAAKSAGHEVGKWGGRGLALAVGWMVLDMLAKAGFAPSSQPLDAIREMLRDMLGTGSS